MHRSEFLAVGAADVPASPLHTSHAQRSATLAADYRRRGFWRDEDLWTSFSSIAARHAAQPMLIDGATRITFGELAQRAARLAGALRRHGVGRGDAVVIHARNSIEATTAMLACAYAGAVMTPVPPMYSCAQLESVLASARPRAVICIGEAHEIAACAQAVAHADGVTLFAASDIAASGGAARRFEELLEGAPLPRVAVGGDELALLVYSSGTTGAPKGVMHSANTLRYAIEQRAALHDVRPGEKMLVVAQFGFVGSIVFGHLLGALTGACSVLMRSWNADQALRNIATHRIGYTLMMPTHVHDMLSSALLDRLDLSCLTRGAMGGLSREQRLELRRRLCPPLPAYGMSECLGFTSCALAPPGTPSPADVDDKALNTEGYPFAGTEVMIVDEQGAPQGRGQTGAIMVRGPSRFLGYHNAPELTRDSVTADGYYRTGDLGWIDEDGCVIFVSREKDIIRRGGVTIVPADLESVLMQHPRVAHVAVVALPDVRLGERACACVITRDGAPLALDELTSFLQQRGVARYTWPESTERFDAFPRSASLKVQKPALVRQILQRAPGQPKDGT